MANRVTLRAPLPVKITNVTYKMEHAWTVNLGYLAVIVIHRVPSTVRTTRVTLRTEHVLHVNLDGLEYTVKQVMWLSKTVYIIKIYNLFLYLFVIINKYICNII